MITIFKVNMDEIIEPDKPMRQSMTQEGLNDLCESIKSVGLLHPILLFKKNARYEIISGHRRYFAHQMLKKDTIDAIIIEDPRLSIEIMRIHENIFREDVSVIDEALYYQYLIEKDNITLEKLGELVGKSISYLSQRINILSYDDKMKQYIENGNISPSVARELSMIDDDNIRNNLTDLAAQGGATVQVVSSWKKEYFKEKMAGKVISSDEIINNVSYETLQSEKYECFVCGADIVGEQVFTILACQDCKKNLYKMKDN